MRFMYLKKHLVPGIAVVALMLLVSFDASAYTCRNKQTGKILKDGDSSVIVPLSRTITLNEQVIFDISQYYECKNDGPGYWSDYMFTQDNASSIELPSTFETGAYIKGEKYAFPLPEVNVLSLPKGGDGDYHSVPIQVFYVMRDTPGQLVKISEGQTIATLKLYKYATSRSETRHDPRYFTWYIVAGNDSIFTSGSCEINHGRNIDIDFGQVVKSQLASSGTASKFKRQVEVPYNCENPVNMSISITLSADTSAFSTDTIKTSNDNLGVQMFQNGQLVRPGDSVHTELVSGIGSSQFEFVLLKNANGTVSSGPFNGSAVLVMSAD